METKSVKQILEDIKTAINDPDVSELLVKAVDVSTACRLEYLLTFLGCSKSKEDYEVENRLLKVYTGGTVIGTKPVIVINEDYSYCVVDMPVTVKDNCFAYVITEKTVELDHLLVQFKVNNVLGAGFCVHVLPVIGCFLVCGEEYITEDINDGINGESEEITLITLVKEYNEKIENVKFGDEEVFEIDASEASEEVRKDFFDLMVAANNPMEFEADFSKFIFNFDNKEKLLQNVEIWDEDECIYVPLAWHGDNQYVRILMDKRQYMERVVSRLECGIYPMDSVRIVQYTANNSIYFVMAK